MTVEGFTDGLGSLLNDRAIQCLEEALTCVRRGLYLSTANLLGAVSEAAWYRLGEEFRARVPALAEALDLNRIAEVQRHVSELLAQVRSNRGSVSELRAHAAYLRDLRNYGVHPSEEASPSREHPCTDMGALLLVFETHRYLVRLLDSAEAADLHLR